MNFRDEFLRLYRAVAACEAPAGTQVDDVLQEYQDAFDRACIDAVDSVETADGIRYDCIACCCSDDDFIHPCEVTGSGHHIPVRAY